MVSVFVCAGAVAAQLACGAGWYRQTAEGSCSCLTPPDLSAIVEHITGLYRALRGDDGDFHSLEYTEKPPWSVRAVFSFHSSIVQESFSGFEIKKGMMVEVLLEYK